MYIYKKKFISKKKEKKANFIWNKRGKNRDWELKTLR
jgi:hypothetical protein